MNLPIVFARLSQYRDKVEGGTYVVERVRAAQDTYLASSADGRPAVFVAVASVSDGPGIRLRNLELRHGMRGDLRTADGHSISGIFTLVECLSHDTRLHRAFLELTAEVLSRDLSWQTTDDIEQSFASLMELFKAASNPSSASWLGTWGELFLIHSSKEPERLLSCWHTDPLKLHDYALGSERLECKTTVGRVRAHEFSLAQLAEEERTVYVASIVTHETVGGISALQLYDEIRSGLRSQDLRLHLDDVVTKVLGSEFDSHGAPRYDLLEASQSLKVYAASSIPAPVNPAPNLVEGVRFRSNLSESPEIRRHGVILKYLAEGGHASA